ncbi:MAG: hypothetical protein JRN32_03460 [Nitrososphaerota archaeon]|nr:hypothetical protein [Nitrososphaerota archaeon]
MGKTNTKITERKDVNEEYTKKKFIDSFMEGLSNPENDFQENAVMTAPDGKKVRVKYAFGMDGRMRYGLSYETYEKYSDYVDEKLREALVARKTNQMKNGFVVNAIIGNLDLILSRKLIPKDLFSELQSKGNIYYMSQEDLEEMDRFFEFPGWKLTKDGEEIIRKYAEKVATAEQKAVAEEVMRHKRAEEEENARKAKEERKLAEEMVKRLKLLDDLGTQAMRIPETHYRPQGEKIQDPRDPENIYGVGRWWVIEVNRILLIKNNGMDGDDWSQNNISTGGAGAIGFQFEKTEEAIKALEFVRDNGEKVSMNTLRNAGWEQ